MPAKPNPNSRSNGYLKLNGNYRHRAVMEIHLGRKLSDRELVHHIDGNKDNNDISNLTLTTRSEHIRLHRPPHAKLTDSQINEIRVSNERSGILAKRYGVNRSTVHRIRTKRSWPTL